jgi:diadenosine tetraphosphate (Ap4A) HIT family hydrolase
MMADCYACDVTAQGDSAPLWERIYGDEHWRVAHAYDSSLLGWLIVLARRHVESLADFTEQEAASLGPLLR